MDKKDAQPKGDFATMGSVNANAINASGTPSRNTKPVAKKGGKGGMIDAATASHRPGILERNGASLHITAPLYQANAAEAGLTQRNVRIVSSRLPRRSNSSADVRVSLPVLRRKKADARTPVSVKTARRTDNQMGVPVEPPISGDGDGASVPEGAGLGVVAVITARTATPIAVSTSAAYR